MPLRRPATIVDRSGAANGTARRGSASVVRGQQSRDYANEHLPGQATSFMPIHLPSATESTAAPGRDERADRTVPASVQLIAFADDWGRSPSSCQHLIRHLLPRHPVLWVNTIGTRRPRFSPEDLGKAVSKFREWLRPGSKGHSPTPSAPRPRVIAPLMYPGFRRSWQRRLNASRMARAIHAALGPRPPGERRVAITTLPITADLPGLLDVDRWVYYCVDDYSVWPGLDGSILDQMEREQVPRMDRVIAVSESLQARLALLGRDAKLLTHGIDPWHWTGSGTDASCWGPPEWWGRLKAPRIVFWGVIDRRLDTSWCLAIAERCGPLVMFGPQQSPDPALLGHRNIQLPGPIPYADLPALAARSDVLVMPYADLPVTRAMQPLKFKEYLATGRPVVARRLPAIAGWDDAADLVTTAEELVAATNQRAGRPIPETQRRAREDQLRGESWAAKAAMFEQAIQGALRDGKRPTTSACLGDSECGE